MTTRRTFDLLLGELWGGDESIEMVWATAGTDRSGEELLLAVDRRGNRHILTRVVDNLTFAPMKGAVTSLSEWVRPNDEMRFLDITCTSDALAEVFALLADDILDRVDDGETSANAMLTALKDWKQLLKPAQAISEETARGLFGELYVLAKLAERNPHGAVDVWAAPTGSVHDFMSETQHLEVKTSRTDGLVVEITSLDQLDTVGGVPLALLRLRVRTQPDGMNIGDMVAQLTGLGCYRPDLVEKLAKVGFILGADPDKNRFTVVGYPAVWEVGEDFPGLRSQDIPDSRKGGITRVKYSVDLLGAHRRLDAAEFETVLSKLVST